MKQDDHPDADDHDAAAARDADPGAAVDAAAVIGQTRAAVGRLRAQLASPSSASLSPPRAAVTTTTTTTTTTTDAPDVSAVSSDASALQPGATDDPLARLLGELLAVQQRLDRAGLFLRALEVAHRAHEGDAAPDEPPAIAPTPRVR